MQNPCHQSKPSLIPVVSLLVLGLLLISSVSIIVSYSFPSSSAFASSTSSTIKGSISSSSMSPAIPKCPYCYPPRPLISPNAQQNGRFGFSVSVSGDLVAVGAPYENSDAGNAYVFNATSGALVATLAVANQSGSEFGYSVSLSGSYVAVGAPLADPGGCNSCGQAYVFSALNGVLVATLTSPNSQSSGEFGYAVSLSGNYVVVGAPTEVAGGQPQAGNVYVFATATGKYIQTLIDPDPQEYGNFGFSVCPVAVITTATRSGEPSAFGVGAPGQSPDGVTGAGSAYVFSSTTGKLIATFVSPNEQEYGNFGYTVSDNGIIFVGGAPYESSGGYSDAGNAYVFDEKTGALTSELTSPSAQPGGMFGFSAAVSGKDVIIGAINEKVDGVAAGNVYEFKSSGTLIHALNSPNAQYGGEFGFAVSASANVVAVSAPCESYPGQVSCSGLTHAFYLGYGVLASVNPLEDGTFGSSVSISGASCTVVSLNCIAVGAQGEDNSYVFNVPNGFLVQTLNTANVGQLGYSISMSGTLVAAGAPASTVDGYNDAGAACIFNATTGALIQEIPTPNAQQQGDFGESISISGTLVAVGAPYEIANGQTEAGFAYVFNATTGTLIQALTSPDPQHNGNFGYSVSISGNAVTVGAPGETSGGQSSAGNAYIFNAKTGALTQTLESPSPQQNGGFGWSVSMSTAKLVAVGAPNEPNGGNAYVFNQATGALVRTLANPNPTYSGSDYAWAVSISGKLLAVGACQGCNAYVFNAESGANVQTITFPGGDEPDYAVSICISGTTVAIGVFTAGALGEAATGVVDLFYNV